MYEPLINEPWDIHIFVNADRWDKHVLNEVLKQILVLIWKAIVHSTNSSLSCVANVSARVRRENWDESKKEPFLLPSLQLSRNNSIGNHCYAGYRGRILMIPVNCWRAVSISILPFMLVIEPSRSVYSESYKDDHFWRQWQGLRSLSWYMKQQSVTWELIFRLPTSLNCPGRVSKSNGNPNGSDGWMTSCWRPGKCEKKDNVNSRLF